MVNLKITASQLTQPNIFPDDRHVICEKFQQRLPSLQF